MGGNNGWVFDRTIHNKYVKVYYNEGYGMISLAWSQNASGNRTDYHWAFTSDPFGNSPTEDQILKRTHYLYCADLIVNGFCATYTETE